MDPAEATGGLALAEAMEEGLGLVEAMPLVVAVPTLGVIAGAVGEYSNLFVCNKAPFIGRP